MERSRPNILITGTPGTGKTTTAALIGEHTGLQVLNVGELIISRELHEGRDEVRDCFIVDEDKLLDEMEDILAEGGFIVDYLSCELFPERWFDLVLVLQTDNTVLFDRLVSRGYSQEKVQENVEAEIMQVLLEEAQSSYAEEIVHACPSNSVEDMGATVARVEQWLPAWLADHARS